MAPVQKVDKGIVRNVRLQVYQYGGPLLSIKKNKKKIEKMKKYKKLFRQ